MNRTDSRLLRWNRRLIRRRAFGRSVSLAFVLLSTSLLPSPGAETNRVFPLMAWNWARSDAAAFREMRECGLTVAGFVSPRDLDLCHAAGLKAIVHDPRVSDYDWRKVDPAEARRRVASLVAETGGHPAVYGYYLRDEPGADLFEGLAVVADLVRALAPGKWPYINLYPNYANARQLGTSTYEEHLARFVATCRPTELSYDHYALMDDGSLRNGYWQNLEQMRSQAQRSQLPFWNIVLTVAHFHYREPTAADLRFQVYSTLAYGGRGIAYFTYLAPQVGNYRAAPLDQFGNRTPTWHALQNVNLQVARLAPVLLELRSDAVYHFGEVPELARPPADDSLVTAAGNAPFVVGDFTHRDGTRFVLIANKDVTRSHPCHPTFRHPPGAVRMISPYTGERVPFEGEHRWLAPGQGVLLRIE